jgi:predicted peptidase
MKRLLILILMLLVKPLTTSAQLMACRGFVEDSYNFWLYLPETYEKAEELPVVMFLHGKSLSGDSLEMVLRYGCIDAIIRGRKINAMVVAPQAQEAWNPQRVMAIYDWLDDHYKVDTNRFYVLGMSMGGYGTLDVAAAYPDRVAAAIALCGGASGKELCSLSTLPLWIVHGTADELVPVWCSDRVVDSIRSCGDTTRLIYNRLEGENHSRLARVFYLEQTYKWLFSHSLLDKDRPVNRSYSMSTELLNVAYDDMGKVYPIEIIEAECPPLRDRMKYHVVKKGESLAEIAVENYTTVSILCRLNNFKKTTKMWAGRKIRVK